jgi:hypothetical protein
MSEWIVTCALCFLPCGGGLNRKLAPGRALCEECVAGGCEVCGADDDRKCRCERCGEHWCDCPDTEFDDWADEQIRLWHEYNQSRVTK